MLLLTDSFSGLCWSTEPSSGTVSTQPFCMRVFRFSERYSWGFTSGLWRCVDVPQHLWRHIQWTKCRSFLDVITHKKEGHYVVLRRRQSANQWRNVRVQKNGILLPSTCQDMSIATWINTLISMAHSFFLGGGGLFGVGVKRINRSKGFVHSHSVSSQIVSTAVAKARIISYFGT